MADTSATEYYITGLRNQHAVESQAVSTIKAQLGRMEAYPELHSRMQQDMTRSEGQATRLEQLLMQHESSTSAAKETVTTIVGKVSGLVHAGSDDDMIKNVLAAIGFKAYEIASYKVLITLAGLAGAASDVPILEQSQKEEMEMGDWLGEHIPMLVQANISHASR